MTCGEILLEESLNNKRFLQHGGNQKFPTGFLCAGIAMAVNHAQ